MKMQTTLKRLAFAPLLFMLTGVSCVPVRVAETLAGFPIICPIGAVANVSADGRSVTFVPVLQNRGNLNSNIPFEMGYYAAGPNNAQTLGLNYGGWVGQIQVPGSFTIPGKGISTAPTGPDTQIPQALLPAAATVPFHEQGVYEVKVWIDHDGAAFLDMNADCRTAGWAFGGRTQVGPLP